MPRRRGTRDDCTALRLNPAMAPRDNATVAPAEAGMRLDRWFRTHYPGLGHGALEKLLRTGQVRVDGRRAKASLRVEAGMAIRVPPLPETPPIRKRRDAPPPTRAEAEALDRRILHRDADVIVIDKPAGLAVQGGTGTRRHLDAMLDALRFGAPERPRLVHRLDKDTSGVLVLARTRAAARFLAAAFRGRGTRKLYLAVTAGSPKPRRGRIALALAKGGGRGAQKMRAGAEGARIAETLYDTLDSAGARAALVALMPITGRTHQLRAHMAAIGAPILGDGKYGGRAAFLEGLGLEKRLHLHARAIEIARPGGSLLRAEAPLPPHMERAMAALGLERAGPEDPFPRD